jgi:hypothetical protein
MSIKNSSDTIGNGIREIWLVAQCLNQLRHQQRAPDTDTNFCMFVSKVRLSLCRFLWNSQLLTRFVWKFSRPNFIGYEAKM